MALLCTFRGRMILSPALQTDRIMLCTADVVPPTIRNACAAPKASAASSSASLITETVQALDFLFLFYVPAHQRERLSSFGNVPVLHIWAHAVVFHNPFDMFLFSCRHVPANTVLSFSNCILPQTGTMIQLFLYIFAISAQKKKQISSFTICFSHDL